MRMALFPWLLMVALLLAMTGCSRYYWSKPGTSPEQFSRDSQECGQQAGATLPGSAAEAVEQYYRACLNSRGYVRATQFDPPPVGSYRGIEDTEQFAALARTGAPAQRQTFEQQLAQLDDMKARGRITPEEYATMRKRLVDGATTDLEWDWEFSNDRGTHRASGTGSVSGEKISLIGRQSAGPAATTPAFSFDLTRDGDVLRGMSRGPNNLPVNVEFTRTRP